MQKDDAKPNDSNNAPTPQPKAESTGLSRREFLKNAAVGLGAAAAAPALKYAPAVPRSKARAADVTTVTFMIGDAEVADAELKAFMDANPDIKVERITSDDAKLKAMLAAGTPPDVIRTSAINLPSYVTRNIFLDLTDRMKASKIVPISDFASACDYYKVSGKYYGLPKDWSPDFSLFVNNDALTETKTAMPSLTEPMSYADLAKLVTTLTKRDGDRTVRMGFGYEPGWLERILARAMAEDGAKLYTDDYSAIKLVGNKRATEALQYFFDLSKANVTWNPLNPVPSSNADSYSKGQEAIVQYGYWFSGYLSTTAGVPSSTFLPSASFGGSKRITPTIGPSGVAVAAATKNPDAAFRLFEWYTGGDPAKARAKSGWGVPALTSLFPLMPSDTPFQKQVQAVLKLELATATQALEVCPYYDSQSVATMWNTELEQALRGTSTFDQLVQNLENDINSAIQDGKTAAGK